MVFSFLRRVICEGFLLLFHLSLCTILKPPDRALGPDSMLSIKKQRAIEADNKKVKLGGLIVAP